MELTTVSVDMAEELTLLKERYAAFDAKARAQVNRELESERKQPVYKQLGLNDLLIDDAYQRAVSHERVMDIVTNFDWSLFNALWVGDRMRRGRYFVVDGRHRLYAASILDIQKVWCEVRPTTNTQEEARVFVQLTQKRRRMNSAQQFQAKLVYGDETAIRIDKLVSKHKFKLQDPALYTAGIQHKDNTISAVGTIEDIYSRGGSKLLDRVLDTLREAWDGTGATLQSAMLRAIARVYERYPDANPKRVAQAIGQKDPWGLIERGQRFGHANGVVQSEAIADVIATVVGL